MQVILKGLTDAEIAEAHRSAEVSSRAIEAIDQRR